MRCYVARSYDTDQVILKILYKALDDFNIQILDSFNDIQISNSIKENIVNSISSVDFVVALILNESAYVLFELGIAVGINKPIFIITGNDAYIPHNISNFTTIRANSKLSENINLPLKQFIDSFRKEQKKNNELRQNWKEKSGAIPDEFIFELENLRRNGTGLDFEKYVNNFFKSISDQFTTSRSSMAKDNGYDYALWIDDLEGILVNPILFEFKFGHINDQVIEKSTSQLLRNNISDSQIAFILYCDRNKRKIKPNIFAMPIIAVEIETFIKKVYETSLPAAIIYFRNSAAHGKEF